MSTTAKQQAMRESALRRLVNQVPPAKRGTWTQDDYAAELRAREPSLFAHFFGSGIDRFFRLQRVIERPRITNDGPAAPAAEHAPYVEPMDAAIQSFRKRAAADLERVEGTSRHMMIRKTELYVCPAYQRDSINMPKVEKIAQSPDMRAFGTLIVAFREGKYWLIDGQHRWMAACRRPDMNELPCQVHDSASMAEEARLFALINLDRTAVRAVDSFRALVTSGDPVAMQLKEALDTLDIQVARLNTGPRQLAAIQFVYRLAQQDMTQCELVLSVSQSISSEVPVSGDLLKALAYINRRVEGGIGNPLLIARLRKIGIHRLLDIADKAKKTRSRHAEQMGLLFMNAINAGLPEQKRFLLKEL